LVAFNGIFSTNRLYHAVEKFTEEFVSDR